MEDEKHALQSLKSHGVKSALKLVSSRSVDRNSKIKAHHRHRRFYTYKELHFKRFTSRFFLFHLHHSSVPPLL